MFKTTLKQTDLASQCPLRDEMLQQLLDWLIDPKNYCSFSPELHEDAQVRIDESAYARGFNESRLEALAIVAKLVKRSLSGQELNKADDDAKDNDCSCGCDG